MYNRLTILIVMIALVGYHIQPVTAQDQSVSPTPEWLHPTESPQSTFQPTVMPERKQLPQSQANAEYTVSSGNIYRNGSEIQLHGVNWFGFETQAHAPAGLWARNWKDMISQMKGAGITAVRVPFCLGTLRSSEVNSIDYSQNQDLQGLDSLTLMDTVLTELDSQGMYILLDHHTPDCYTLTPLWYTDSYPEGQWVQDLKFVAERYMGLENLIGIDLKNEPHGQATWGTGERWTDWKAASEWAGREVLAVNPNLLIFVEGIADNPTCSTTHGHWWGGNLAPAACAKLDLPADKVVYSPHVFGRDLYAMDYFFDPSFPSNLPAIWTADFGHLADSGHTVVIGEWGSLYGDGADQIDVTVMNTLVDYLISKHICNSFYWNWGPNSDIGGILSDDWMTPHVSKISLLQRYWNSC